MARFTFNGIDSLQRDLEKLERIDNDTKWSILEAGANVFLEIYTKRLRAQHWITGTLARALRIDRMQDGEVARIWPIGKYKKQGRRTLRERHAGSGASKRSKHHGSAGGSTTMDVAYYLEYGTPRMAATHWMEYANEEAEEPSREAMQEAWNKHLEDCGF